MTTAHQAPLPRETGEALGRWLRSRAASVRTPLAGAVAAGTLSGIALIAQCWLIARIVDGAVVHHQDLHALSPWLSALLGSFALRAVTAIVSEAVAFEAGARVTLTVRTELLDHLETLGPSFTRLRRAGELGETIVGAAEGIGRYYSGYLPQTALVATVPLAILAFVVPTDWVSGLIMALSAPLIPVFMIIIGKGTEALNQTQWRTLARLSGHVFNAIGGLTTLKLFGASRAEAAAVATISDQYRRATMMVLRVAFLSSLVLEFLATVSIAMVAVYVGFRLYYGEMRLLPGLAVLLVAPEFYRMLRAMGSQYHARMEAIGAAGTIAELLAVTPAPTPSGRLVPGSAAIELVRLEGVGFARSGMTVLDGVDLTLRRGCCVGLVGPSGTGKTTLAEVLLGFAAPSRGRISVDGVDLALISPAAWRRRIAWLPQRPTLFHGTVLDNIRLGDPDADLEAVRRALELAAADEVVGALPQGWDTVLGDGGQGLSGGEIQRIALARVFLKRADLLVLDEPTTGLDRALAERVAHSIAFLSATRATLVIAHDEMATRRADLVVSLEHGRLCPVRRIDAAAEIVA